MILVYRPALLNPRTNLKLALTSDVGNCFSTTPCKAEIIYERNAYYPGEIAKVTLIVDNTECKAAVKSFKFKLLQFSMCSDPTGFRKNESTDYLVDIQEEG